METDREKPGFSLLNAKSGLDCDEREANLHAEETVCAIERVEAELGRGKTFIAETYFLDPAHEGASGYYLLSAAADEADFRELGAMIEATDCKNMVDVAIEGKGRSLAFVSNGQGYWVREGEGAGYHNVREVISLRQLTAAAGSAAKYSGRRELLAEDFRDAEATKAPAELMEVIRQEIERVGRRRESLREKLGRAQDSSAAQNNRRAAGASKAKDHRR